MSAVTADAVWTGTKVDVRLPGVFAEALKKAKWVDGQTLVIRVEPEDEAWRYTDLKHLFGHVYGPVVEYTGYSKEEFHLLMKSQFMPEGKTSLTQLNRDELKEYTMRVDQHLRESIPDAYVLMETRAGGNRPPKETCDAYE